jgi:hypothetical protein
MSPPAHDPQISTATANCAMESEISGDRPQLLPNCLEEPLVSPRIQPFQISPGDDLCLNSFHFFWSRSSRQRWAS